MEQPLFEQVGEVARSMTPSELGVFRSRSHRRGIKVWFDTEKAGREHFEAQLLARRHVDGTDGMALEVGFHAEHREEDKNEAVIDLLNTRAIAWRKSLGDEAEVGRFFGADGWRRISEVWLEPDLEDPDLAFEVAARLVDYVTVIEPARKP
jgi:hypothetical protein